MDQMLQSITDLCKIEYLLELEVRVLHVGSISGPAGYKRVKEIDNTNFLLSEIKGILGYKYADEVIHRNNLVIRN